jgi:enoyl-CoA hydratase/carnithine racemase
MTTQHILVERGTVAKIILNRPDVRNAMSDLTLRELTDAFRSLGQDSSLRVVVVTGTGQDFCAGGDLEWMRRGVTMNAEEGKRDVRLISDMLSAISQCPVPVIVAAQGHVFGGGLGLLAPPRLFSLEQAIEYIERDELVEITPKNIRLRKKFLSEHDRKRNDKN